MIMPHRLRKLALTAHMAASVGWLGAVIAFLPIAVVGLTSQDAPMVRGAYRAMALIGWYTLVPLAFASLATGILQSIGTAWGLFRHYWVLAKLTLSVLSTFVLINYMQGASFVADQAADPMSASDLFLTQRTPSSLLHAGSALLVLLAATMLAVFKPRGMTRYGWRKHHEEAASSRR